MKRNLNDTQNLLKCLLIFYWGLLLMQRYWSLVRYASTTNAFLFNPMTHIIAIAGGAFSKGTITKNLSFSSRFAIIVQGEQPTLNIRIFTVFPETISPRITENFRIHICFYMCTIAANIWWCTATNIYTGITIAFPDITVPHVATMFKLQDILRH